MLFSIPIHLLSDLMIFIHAPAHKNIINEKVSMSDDVGFTETFAVFSHTSVMALGMAMSVCRTEKSKQFDGEIYFRHPWSPEDESE